MSPSENEYVDIDMDKNAYEYYKQKDFFLRENNFFEKKIPNMEIEYDTSCIESELANLNQLLIEVTDECNLSCKYCSYGDLYSNQDERNRGKQEFNNVKILIDYLISLWKSYRNISFNNTINIGFFGGEPLVNMILIHCLGKTIRATDDKSDVAPRQLFVFKPRRKLYAAHFLATFVKKHHETLVFDAFQYKFALFLLLLLFAQAFAVFQVRYHLYIKRCIMTDALGVVVNGLGVQLSVGFADKYEGQFHRFAVMRFYGYSVLRLAYL